MRYAGFWRRLAADFIDGLIIVPFWIAYTKIVPDVKIWSFTWLVLVVICSMYSICFWMKYRATPGMMLVKTRIVTKENEAFTLWRAILRYIGLYISYEFIIGVLWMLWDKNKQMWADKIAKTYVIITPDKGIETVTPPR